MERSSRLSRAQWLSLGFAAMTETGPNGLTIDALCARAGRTKGSFYHHFKTAEAFASSLAGHWLKHFAADFNGSVAPRLEPRRDLLNQLAARLDFRLETSMRALAARDSAVRQVCTTADNVRIGWLERGYRQVMAPDQAASLARIEYAALIGFLVTQPDADLKPLYATFLKLTGR